MILNVRATARLLVFVVISAAITACFDNEPEQRKAFITFLQTRMIDRPGVRIPKVSDEDVKALGPYVTHFNVIKGFTNDPVLTATAEKMHSGLPNLTSIQSVVDNRDRLRKTKVELGEMLNTMNEKYASTLKERDALKQPDDLKVVYNKAFDKTVTLPTSAFREAVPLAQGIIDAAANVGDYVASHTDTVKINGGQLQPTNTRTQSELTALVNALTAQGAKFNEAQRKVRAAITGN
jgi:hypothetical protein